jgi:DNA-binding NarL/FixJ family response regulator
MSGLQVAREVRARRPSQVIILYSAFLDEGVEREAMEAGVDLCLPKLEGLPSLEREIARFAGTPS